MKYCVELTALCRQQCIKLEYPATSFKFSCSRDKCNDVLCELVSPEGKAVGKPLHKYIPGYKHKSQVKELRFTMNDFSTRPIKIEIEAK